MGKLRRTFAAVVATACVVGGLGAAEPASATTFALNVDTASDSPANSAQCTTSTTVVPEPLSLRNALCLADNIGGTVVVNVPAGTYTTPSGELAFGNTAGMNVTIQGGGSGSTFIDGGGAHRVIDIDPTTMGGITVAINGVTIRNGSDSTLGGAGIIAGSDVATTGDSLTITNSAITSNQANPATPTVINNPGGGVQFAGGTLSISNSTFSNNGSQSSPGAAISYQAEGAAAGESFTLQNSTISGNSVTNTYGSSVANGGAVDIAGPAGTPSTVSGVTFSGNTGSGTSGPVRGGALRLENGTLALSDSVFTNNSTNTNGTGGAVEIASGTATLRRNRFVGNVSPTGSAVDRTGGSADAQLNWWGCNAGPGNTGCDATSGTVTSSPRLVLTATAPSTIFYTGSSTTFTGDLTHDSTGASVTGPFPALDGLTLGFGTVLPTGATCSPTSAVFSGGTASGSCTYAPNGHSGAGQVALHVDNQLVTKTIEVDQPAAVLDDPLDTTVLAGSTALFSASADGYPAPGVQWQRKASGGSSFTDIAGATSTTLNFSAAPADDGAQYRAHFVNSTGNVVTAAATLTVHQPPAFTSPGTTTFSVGTPGSFGVTTSGLPTVTAITQTGSLPHGLSYTDNHDGTATISGTPLPGTGGVTAVSLEATNGISPDDLQTLVITVDEAPVVTTDPSDATAAPGDPVSFTAGASGYPAPTVQWQVKTGGGSNFANVAGATGTTYAFTAALADSGNEYRAVLTNGSGSATTAPATLTIQQPPSITSASSTTFAVGAAGSFGISSDGIPDATISTSTTLPAWLTLTPGAGGSATLAGTPPTGSGGTYAISLEADNGVGTAATQTFVLTVEEAPHISSAATAAFTVGSSSAFLVAIDRGYGTPSINIDGALPTGLSFADNGDGTGTISGIAASGTGGTYPLTITADNGVGSADVQAFTLVVDEPRTITSSDHATFAVGSTGSFVVTTWGGYPAVTTLTKAGALPGGVTFVDNGDGTATLAGRPDPGSEGSYPLVITAANGVGGGTTQLFTLTVTAVPMITSADHATFIVGSAGSFGLTTDPGYPTTTTLDVAGTLPLGVSYTDNGDGTGTLAGTPASGTAGSYPLTVTATNAKGNSTQSFTLTVNEAPTITSSNNATFTADTLGSFTVTTTGAPDAALTEAGALPGGVTFVDKGDGTATLSGTPTTGSGGVYRLTLSADNGVTPADSQAFALAVDEAPAITSANSASFGSGVAGTFTVTTIGYPVPALTETGALPGGVTLVDNGDGTATLAGTPDAATAGTWPITLTAANGLPSDATQAFTLNVTTGTQTISFTSTPPTTGVVGQTYQVSATGGASGNPVTFDLAVASAGVCSRSGSTVTFDHAGTCVIDAQQAGDAQYAPATAAQSVPVTKASTGTTVSVHPTTITAAVAVVAPGAGAPSGLVNFAVDGSPVGSASLTGGTATLSYTVPTGHARNVSATYAGDADFAGSAGSTARTDPSITATVSSSTARTGYGWYRSAVTVTFHCQAAGAPLTAACPAPVTFTHDGAGQSVTRMITATDGGADSVTVKGINVDRTRPTLAISGVRSGATYMAGAPTAKCVGKDAVSGIAACRLTRTKKGDRVTVAATATDRAGNQTSTRVTYTVLRFFVQGASYRNGAFVLREGHVYVLVALTTSTTRPRLYDAAPVGRTPYPADNLLSRAGTQNGLHRYTIAVHIDAGLGRYTYWNLGIKVGRTMHLVKFHPVR